MNVSLTAELERFVKDKVASGMYLSASEVIREGLRLLAEHDRAKELRIEELHREIQVGLDQLDRGEGISSAEVFGELKRRLESGRGEDSE